MIELDITGVHFQPDDQIKRYVIDKISKLDKYLPRGSRTPAHGRVVLTEAEGKSKNRYSCEVILTLPHGALTAKDSTISMYAAIDIVEEKIKVQILKVKDKRQNDRHARRGKRMLKGWRFRSPFGGDQA